VWLFWSCLFFFLSLEKKWSSSCGANKKLNSKVESISYYWQRHLHQRVHTSTMSHTFASSRTRCHLKYFLFIMWNVEGWTMDTEMDIFLTTEEKVFLWMGRPWLDLSKK
jgi:hypothetical protein